jgi:hypothetical protein
MSTFHGTIKVRNRIVDTFAALILQFLPLCKRTSTPNRAAGVLHFTFSFFKLSNEYAIALV